MKYMALWVTAAFMILTCFDAAKGQNDANPCVTQSICPSMNFFNTSILTQNRRCRECIHEYCDSMQQVTDLMCIRSAYDSCMECPALANGIQMSRRRCMNCLRQKTRDENGVKARLTNEPMRRYHCLRRCYSPTRCPSRDEVDAFIQTNSPECESCLVAQCGAYNNDNRSNIANCRFQARRICTDCSVVLPADRRRMRQCMACNRNCASVPIPNPLQGMSCLQTCHSNDKCQSWKAMATKMQKMSVLCRRCILSECGSFHANNAGCIEEARVVCMACPMMMPKEQMMMKGCRSCIRSCLYRPNSPSSM